MFCVYRSHYSVDSFGNEENDTEEIIDGISNFSKSIELLNQQRDKDIKIHRDDGYIYSICMNACCGFEISYVIGYSEDGFPYNFDIYRDHYRTDFLDDNCDEEGQIIQFTEYGDDYWGNFYNIDKIQKKNIKKCISNCLLSDKKKISWKGKGKLDKIGDIDYDYITKLLEEQNFKCYKCDDKLTTYLYVPYCSYKFSIDRIDNLKPHNKDNIKISCYFCNCKEHPAYDKIEKVKCDDKKCFCNNKLFRFF